MAEQRAQTIFFSCQVRSARVGDLQGRICKRCCGETIKMGPSTAGLFARDTSRPCGLHSGGEGLLCWPRLTAGGKVRPRWAPRRKVRVADLTQATPRVRRKRELGPSADKIPFAAPRGCGGAPQTAICSALDQRVRGRFARRLEPKLDRTFAHNLYVVDAFDLEHHHQDER